MAGHATIRYFAKYRSTFRSCHSVCALIFALVMVCHAVLVHGTSECWHAICVPRERWCCAIELVCGSFLSDFLSRELRSASALVCSATCRTSMPSYFIVIYIVAIAL